MTKAIVFDFDGVIVDSEPLHYRAFIDVLRKWQVGFNYHQYVERYAGFDDREAFCAMFADGPNPDLRQLDAALISQLCAQKADAFQTVLCQGIDTIPGILDFIVQAGRDLPMAIASGATLRDIEPILDRLGLTHQFDPVITADDVRRSKPDPATYRLAVQGLNQRLPQRAILPADCVAIEDTPAGIESARRAGLNTVGLTTTHPAHMLQQAHRVIDSATQLSVNLLSSWFN